MLRVQECLQELKAKPWAGWHKYIRVSLYPMSERKRAGEMCKGSQGSETALQSCAEEGAGDAGGYQEVLVATLARASGGMLSPFDITGCFVLALGTIYGFRENTTERNADLGSCMSAEIPTQRNFFHSHFGVCGQVLIML